jgi:hypothetical protein
MPSLLYEKHGIDRDIAAQLSMLPILMGMLAAPFYGLFMDKFGKKAHQCNSSHY